jgi:CHAT domain-containing protein/tetratricopeptide (TPR) repeat protein
MKNTIGQVYEISARRRIARNAERIRSELCCWKSLAECDYLSVQRLLLCFRVSDYGHCVLLALLLAAVQTCAQELATRADAGAEVEVPATVRAELDGLESAWKKAQMADEAGAESYALNALANARYRISEFRAAADEYSQALILARTAKDAIAEAQALNGLADCERGKGENQKAQEHSRQALAVALAAGDERGQATALNGLGWTGCNLGQCDAAMELHQRALHLAEKVKDAELQAMVWNRIGIVEDTAGDTEKALRDYGKALELWRTAGDGRGEGATENNIGVLYAGKGDKKAAVEHYTRALVLRKAAGDRAGTAATLNNLGVVAKNAGAMDMALGYYRQALPFLHAVGDRASEAMALTNLGNIDTDLGRNKEALEAYNRALVLAQASGGGLSEAGILLGLGNLKNVLGEKQTALDDLNQALKLWQTAGRRKGEATALNSIGVVYDDLGDSKEALDYYNRALKIQEEIGDGDGQATSLSNIAGIYNAPEEKQKALGYYSQALELQRAAGDNPGIARTLNNMGLVYEDLGQRAKALELYQLSLPIRHQLGDPGGEAMALNNIGNLLDDGGAKEKALEYYGQALPLATEASDPLRVAQILRNLMLNRKAAQPGLAIFYGKQAVNLLQQVRGNIQGMDRKLQASFLSTKDNYYHELAELLIAQGRLPEAEQVLDLLKQQEYADYVRGETANTLKPLTLDADEQQAEADYQRSTKELVAAGREFSELKQNPARTAEEEKRFNELAEQLKAASKGLNDYYARLYRLFGANEEANKQKANVEGNVSALKRTIAKMPHTVALYTLVTADHYRVIVITAGATVAREYAIAEKGLNAKIAAFEEALRDPGRDPRPLGRELYEILIGPVEADLAQAKAETLVWSLDGALRYVPLAALYDGKQYGLEKWETVTITPASIPLLNEKPDVAHLSAAAMGISRKYEAGLPALPAVAGELSDVVRSGEGPGALPGTILLDGQFTEKAMEEQLGGRNGVVHIASHFVFKPGDDSKSYLLLAGQNGEGFHLSVAEFRDNVGLSLEATELLTLSACDTGMSGNAGNGREVDGLGTTAQLKGARAVISTLWEVNDRSTGRLMGDFYRRWAEGGGKVTKVEALRQAQLDLLRGSVATSGPGDGRGFPAGKPLVDTPKGYAHPYYWAPFVLMGNWR